jgi:hypothetical protein
MRLDQRNRTKKGTVSMLPGASLDVCAEIFKSQMTDDSGCTDCTQFCTHPTGKMAQVNPLSTNRKYL